MVINDKSDAMLLSLRKPEEKGYKIPHGFLFKYISCPNHFGEILEWLGFAILSWNIASLSFAIWTFANLAPRAIAHHRWYKEHFPNYPRKRKAVLPRLL
jgi:steroid 5-alpha reductase family enzyme